MRLMVCAVAMSFFLCSSNTVLARSASINGDQNRCSVAISGDANTVNISCQGFDPEIARKLFEANVDNAASQEVMTDQLNDLIGRFEGIRAVLEQVREDNRSTRRAWQALREGDVEAAERITSVIEDMLPRLKRIEQNTDMSAIVAVVDRALEMRNGSEQGQVSAIERLLAKGNTFTGYDFSGVSLSGGKLRNGDFSNGRFHFSALDHVDATLTNFDDTGLRFVDFTASNFTGANISNAFAPFVFAASPPNFSRSKIVLSNFLGAALTGADFSGAILRGTSFAFADLTGANFAGADLTETQFVGAVLDDANFDDAIFQETNVIGASARSVSLTDSQREGLCRAPIAFRHGAYTEISISLSESYPSARYASGTGYDDFYSGYFGSTNMTDKSLPVCKEMKNSPPGYHAKFPGEERMNLSRDYLGKSSRKRFAKERVKSHFEKVLALLTEDAIIRGNFAQSENWRKHLNERVSNVDSIGSPHLNTEQVLMLLIKYKIVAENDVEWKKMAQLRFGLDAKLHQLSTDQVPNETMWAQFYPSDAVWDDLPEEHVELYRNWVLKRLPLVPNRLIFRPAALARQDTESSNWYGSTKTGFLRETLEGQSTSGSVPNGSTDDITTATPVGGSILLAPIYHHSMSDSVERVFMAFAKPYEELSFEITPDDVPKGVKLLPVDFTLEVEKVERLKSFPSIVFLYVRPVEAVLGSENGSRSVEFSFRRF